MRFEVPQFIDIEDKIFGPLSWRQFVYLGGGLGMAGVLFLTSKLLFLFIGLPLAVLAFALAFFPVNNRPFSFFLEAIFNYVSSTRLYLWKQQSKIVYDNSFSPFTPQEPLYVDATRNARDQQEKNNNLTSLARKLELQALQKNQE